MARRRADAGVVGRVNQHQRGRLAPGMGVLPGASSPAEIAQGESFGIEGWTLATSPRAQSSLAVEMAHSVRVCSNPAKNARADDGRRARSRARAFRKNSRHVFGLSPRRAMIAPS